MSVNALQVRKELTEQATAKAVTEGLDKAGIAAAVEAALAEQPLQEEGGDVAAAQVR